MATEFTRMTEPLDYDRIQRCLRKGIMPAAVVLITDAATDNIYTTLASGEPNGLPVMDLGGLRAGETLIHYLRFRIQHRFGLQLDRSRVEVLPFETKASLYMETHNNKRASNDWDIHHRFYVPTIAEAIQHPRGDGLTLVVPEIAAMRVRDGQGGADQRQLEAVQHEIVNRLVGIKPVPEPATAQAQ